MTFDRSQKTADITIMTVKSSWYTADSEHKHIKRRIILFSFKAII